MIIEITPENVDSIKNPVFSSFAKTYLQIYADFLSQIGQFGVWLDSDDYQKETEAKYEALRKKGALFRNEGKSIYVNAISPACIACQTGVESETFFISLKCHRECYFCFNPNQVNYEYYSQHERDLIAELDQLHAGGLNLKHLAVTGGEPLLHREHLVHFFAHAGKRYPGVYKRLYTCGDHLNAEILQELKDAGLQEIRLSIRMHDLDQGHRHTLQRIALAKEYIRSVMVEMPVLPDRLEAMKKLLLELNDLQIDSINLLEFCYPFSDPTAYNERGFKLKKRPYQIPYNYWYAGGLPIAQSELVCLDLLDFAIEANIMIGVHYCSLENKFTAQIYELNAGKTVPGYMYFSPRDYFYKSAKVFGKDIPQVLAYFERKKLLDYHHNEQLQYLEFHVKYVKRLMKMDVEVGIATSVIETREGDSYMRELKLDLVRPDKFEFRRDV